MLASLTFSLLGPNRVLIRLGDLSAGGSLGQTNEEEALVFKVQLVPPFTPPNQNLVVI